MNPAGKALWYVESHFSRELTLEEIADLAGVSRHHVSRAFGAATGRSIMRYVRGRRLTEAARSLSDGAPDILAVALEAGYGSHEAFTRAFRDQFGVTPEMVRAQGHLGGIELVEPVKMDETFIANLKPSRFENGKPLLVAGLSQRYTCETSARHTGPVAAIPAVLLQAARASWQDGLRCHLQRRRGGRLRLLVRCRDRRCRRCADGIRARARAGTTVCGVRASRPHLDDSRHLEHDLKQVASGVRTRSRGRAELRALRRGIRFRDWNGRPGDLDPDQDLRVPCTA